MGEAPWSGRGPVLGRAVFSSPQTPADKWITNRITNCEEVPTMGRKPAPCGTFTAYKRHRRNGEEPCEKCVAAAQVQSRIQTNRRNLRSVPAEVVAAMPVESLPEPEDILRRSLVKLTSAIDAVLASDPAKVSPLIREQRGLVQDLRNMAEKPEEATLADELARARAARSARTAN